MSVDGDTPIPIILAAGAGRRLGGNKALLRLGEATLLELALAAVRDSLLGRPLVVTGCAAEEVEAIARRGGALTARNPSWEGGMTGSIQTGLRSLPRECPAFLLYPVDHAFVRARDLDALARAWAARKSEEPLIFRPRCGEALGHPVLFDRSFAAEFLALGPDEPGHLVYRRHLDRVMWVEVDNPSIARDLDAPEDLEDLPASDPPPR